MIEIALVFLGVYCLASLGGLAVLVARLKEMHADLAALKARPLPEPVDLSGVHQSLAEIAEMVSRLNEHRLMGVKLSPGRQRLRARLLARLEERGL